MSNLTGNKNPSDIFKIFEPGSEGKCNAEDTVDVISDITKDKKISTFTGYLKLEGGIIILDTLGGVKVKVDLKDSAVPLDDVINKIVTIRGEQIADKITSAFILLSSKPGTKSASLIKTDNTLKELAEITKKFLITYKSKIQNLLSARPGYKTADGVITKIPAIVAIVDKKIHEASLSESELIPKSFLNYDIEVVSASPRDILLYKYSKEAKANPALSDLLQPGYLESLAYEPPKDGIVETEEVLEITTNYIPPTNVQLEEITDAMTMVCHVSPEGGWKTLRPFIEDVNDHLQIAMYDFSAPHIFKSLKEVLKRGAELKIVYDGNSAAGVGSGSKEDDVKEETMIRSFQKIGGKNFDSVKAWKGNGGICANAYHIKVAVKDSESFWLSSGNWQSSNQPNEDFGDNISALKKFNREWNVLVYNKKLAEIFYKFIDWDYARSLEKPEAEFMEMMLPELFTAEIETEEAAGLMMFPPRKFVFTKNKPLRVQPVLSPDNYIENAISIIRSAKKSLYFQNQYIKINDNVTPEYKELLDALLEKINDDKIDGRILLRGEYASDTKAMLDNLQAYGFEMSKVRTMPKTHTKGIIADGQRILIGSHNWSNAGVQYNRDASLLIYNDEISLYYQDVFLHDWERRTKKRNEDEMILLSGTDTESAMISEGLAKFDWGKYLD